MKYYKEIIMEKYSSIQDAIEKKKGKFLLRGWIKRKRAMKDNIFIILRDSSNTLQCVISKSKVSDLEWENAEKALIESSISIFGNLKKDERAPNGVEMQAEKFEVVSFADDFPIQKDLSESFLLDVRHLWLRSSKMVNAMKMRSTLFHSFHEFMRQHGYYEIHNPSFVSGAVEGGATLFEVPYFGDKVYLTQSGQFYNEAYITALEKVYTIAPSFRAEKSRTRRHVTEYWHAEWETAWQNLEGLMDFTEDLVKNLCKSVLEKHEDELKFFKRKPEVLEKVVKAKKFERFTYDEIFDIARKKFTYLKWGDDLGEKEEREITKDYDVPIFITHFPAKLKPFYHRPDPENPDVVLCCDLLAPEGYGEIVGAGERCWDLNELERRLIAEGLKPETYEWYFDLRRYGSVPHSGAGLGMARTLTWIANLPHIRDAIGFPRTMNRFYP